MTVIFLSVLAGTFISAMIAAIFIVILGAWTDMHSKRFDQHVDRALDVIADQWDMADELAYRKLTREGRNGA